MVTEAESLVAYVRSIVCQTALTENPEELRLAVQEHIAAKGAIHIQKDSGMFVATKTCKRCGWRRVKKTAAGQWCQIPPDAAKSW